MLTPVVDRVVGLRWGVLCVAIGCSISWARLPFCFFLVFEMMSQILDCSNLGSSHDIEFVRYRQGWLERVESERRLIMRLTLRPATPSSFPHGIRPTIPPQPRAWCDHVCRRQETLSAPSASSIDPCSIPFFISSPPSGAQQRCVEHPLLAVTYRSADNTSLPSRADCTLPWGVPFLVSLMRSPPDIPSSTVFPSSQDGRRRIAEGK